MLELDEKSGHCEVRATLSNVIDKMLLTYSRPFEDVLFFWKLLAES